MSKVKSYLSKIASVLSYSLLFHPTLSYTAQRTQQQCLIDGNLGNVVDNVVNNVVDNTLEAKVE